MALSNDGREITLTIMSLTATETSYGEKLRRQCLKREYNLIFSLGKTALLGICSPDLEDRDGDTRH